MDAEGLRPTSKCIHRNVVGDADGLKPTSLENWFGVGPESQGKTQLRGERGDRQQVRVNLEGVL